MSFARRLYLAMGATLGVALASPAAAAAVEVNEDFKPQNEFKLEPWVELHVAGIDMSINKAVFMLVLSASLTVALLVWVARRLEAKPNRVQTAVELSYDLVRNTITRTNIRDEKIATRWFPFLMTLFFFILFNNLIGFLPLPIDTAHKIDVFGVGIPQLGLYAATANLSVPLMLTLMVWSSYHVEGIRMKGPLGYLKSWVPTGVEGAVRIPVFAIEVISHFVRLVSLSVRLFANMLAGHMLILIMGGGMIILLGTVLVAPLTLPLAFAFYVFEVVIVANLQAFIFAILTSIYIGDAVAAEH